uniref:Uncharacterized protein n=1 Tax=Timspurckia oligopyrenoides TaxID=708627 RepID=A0A7S0ZJW7_9RHOD|mmetsp:Transcript_8165/g.14792  ORF Transcript_8165/g.14792 Transcript_8165/m.14792 type:complete len:471 (+) Transcript_8165:243-1655(+)
MITFDSFQTRLLFQSLPITLHLSGHLHSLYNYVPNGLSRSIYAPMTHSYSFDLQVPSLWADNAYRVILFFQKTLSSASQFPYQTCYLHHNACIVISSPDDFSHTIDHRDKSVDEVVIVVHVVFLHRENLTNQTFSVYIDGTFVGFAERHLVQSEVYPIYVLRIQPHIIPDRVHLLEIKVESFDQQRITIATRYIRGMNHSSRSYSLMRSKIVSCLDLGKSLMLSIDFSSAAKWLYSAGITFVLILLLIPLCSLVFQIHKTAGIITQSLFHKCRLYWLVLTLYLCFCCVFPVLILPSFTSESSKTVFAFALSGNLCEWNGICVYRADLSLMLVYWLYLLILPLLTLFSICAYQQELLSQNNSLHSAKHRQKSLRYTTAFEKIALICGLLWVTCQSISSFLKIAAAYGILYAICSPMVSGGVALSVLVVIHFVSIEIQIRAAKRRANSSVLWLRSSSPGNSEEDKMETGKLE